MSQPTHDELAALLDSIETAVLAVDTDWRFTYFNTAADALLRELGHSAETLLGKDFWLEFPEFGGSICERELRRAVAERARVTFDSHHAALDRWVRLQATPTRDGLAVALADVTARKAAKRIEEERAFLLASERAARSEAEAANRSKDEFLAILSHELRTPLTAVLGWTRMLRMAKLDSDAVQRALEAIERNTRSQTQLINDLLDVSRIITGKLEMEREPVHVLPAIRTSIESLADAAERKHITVDTRLDASVGTVLGDDMRLCQIVTNLIGNAVKFTPDGGHVTVGLAAVGDEVLITVSDDGVGIAADDLPRVFDRFHQGHVPRRSSVGGLGLGLAIVQHLVKQHQGRVTAHSDGPGKGATFCVFLPRADAAQSAQLRRSGAPQPLDVELRGVGVLVVEDDPDGREIIREILRTQGAEVTTAASAEEALEVLATRVPQLLVSDIGLGGIDGFGLMRRVRALPGPAAGILAIALTAYARAEDRTTALAAGFQMHLSKPIEPRELQLAVAQLLDRAR